MNVRATIAGLGICLAAGGALFAEPAPKRFTTSDRCATCHRDIHRMWNASAHASAMNNTTFLDSYREVESGRGSSSPGVCLGCHAPMAGAIGDPELTKRISWEGVTCDYCHSLVSVEMHGSGAVAGVDFGNVKRGPIKDATSTGHDVAYSDLFAQSIVCAPCHEYTARNGAAIMGTYSEWMASNAAERGETCQTCHMGVVEGEVVDPRIARESGAEVNLHAMPGGHSLDQLHEAIAVGIEPSRHDDRLELVVRLKNKGAGHAVPTGMPVRHIVLELLVETETGRSFHEQRTYGKYYKDSRGKTIEQVADLFGEGVQLQSDSRIAADEVRTETFDLAVPAKEAAYATVKLHYEHAPRGEGEDGVRVTFFAERRMIRPDAEEEPIP